MANRRGARVWTMRLAAVASAGLLLGGCSSDVGPARSPGAEADAPTMAPTALVLDASGSMTEADAPGPDGAVGTRMAAAAGAANTLIDAMPAGTEFALVTYGTGTGGSEAEKAAGCGDVTTLVPLGAVDPATAKAAVDAIVPSGYTPIAAALRHAANELPATGDQAIVLVSDGEDTCDAPPCDVAAELHGERPGLTISTVGFRTGGAGDADLACIASTTGGLFVTAEDAGQLASRLRATQNLAAAKTALTATGLGGAELGQTADQIRANNPDLPAVDGAGEVVIVWRDCDLTFTDGTLTAIAPHDGGRTIDGIAAGSTLREATDIYGPPVSQSANSDGSFLSILAADKNAGNAYKMTTDGTSDDAAISRIVLCKCLPGTGAAAPRDPQPSSSSRPTSSSRPASPAAQPATSADPSAMTFGGTAQIQAGIAEADLASVGINPIPAKAHGCNFYPVPGAAGLNVFAANGQVLGVRPETNQYGSPVGEAHTAEGIRIGNTAARVRDVYRGATLTESFQGRDGTKLILVTDGSGGAIGFRFDRGNDTSDSVPDSATVLNIFAGTKELASGYEVCSG